MSMNSPAATSRVSSMTGRVRSVSNSRGDAKQDRCDVQLDLVHQSHVEGLTGDLAARDDDIPPGGGFDACLDRIPDAHLERDLRIGFVGRIVGDDEDRPAPCASINLAAGWQRGVV
jgi:hypothetical protein